MAQQRYNNEEHDRYLLGSPASSTSSANSSIQHLEDSDFFHDPTGFLVRLASRIENPSIQQELTSNPAADGGFAMIKRLHLDFFQLTINSLRLLVLRLS